MAGGIHGTIDDPKRQHPVFDLRHWEGEFPLGEDRHQGGCIYSPAGLAKREQAVRLARTRGDLGLSVQTDVFVWSDRCVDKRPWLTRIGGTPWREKDKPWPKGDNGAPLMFLGQICFTDSRDLIPFDLPGDVALIFGSCHNGWASLADGWALDWSPMNLKVPEDRLGTMPYATTLSIEYHGVIHRTRQYPDDQAAEGPFVATGWKKGGYRLADVQMTSIGTHSGLPQGWPFKPGDGCTLVGVLSSFLFEGKWPLCDTFGVRSVNSVGAEPMYFHNSRALQFMVHDMGAIWLYRDKQGKFKLDFAC